MAQPLRRKCLTLSTYNTICPSYPIPEPIPGRNGCLYPSTRFMAAFCIIATKWKWPRCPSPVEWISISWHMWEYYPAVKKNRPIPGTNLDVSHRCMIKRKKPDTKQLYVSIYCDSIYVRFFGFFFKIIFIYLFMAVLGLRCCSGFSLDAGEGAILHCGVWASHCGGFSCCRAQALGRAGFSSCGSCI